MGSAAFGGRKCLVFWGLYTRGKRAEGARKFCVLCSVQEAKSSKIMPTFWPIPNSNTPPPLVSPDFDPMGVIGSNSPGRERQGKPRRCRGKLRRGGWKSRIPQRKTSGMRLDTSDTKRKPRRRGWKSRRRRGKPRRRGWKSRIPQRKNLGYRRGKPRG